MSELLLSIALILQPSPASASPQEHQLGEELVTGQAEVKIQDIKPFFTPQLDPFTPINDLLAPGTYVFDDALFRTVDSATVPYHFIRSSYLRVPVERSFIYSDIMVFLPTFEKRVATWELVVSNSLGETVRRVTRKGQPPAVISWDGRTESGELIAAGDIYSFTFNAYDAQGNQTRIPGSPQRIAALATKLDNEWIVSIAADQIFEADRAAVSAEAAPRLDEAANIIKEHFRKEVVVYVYSEQERLSNDRCAALRAEIVRRVVLPADAIKVAPRFIPGLQPKHSRVEIHVL
uniref:FlgD/Vpr Ig-like domain-containing protein n=1 Tax=candidate division WOR-3 bacterium TaxID=2052148 RepID=A0A7C4GGY3_UNCW3